MVAIQPVVVVVSEKNNFEEESLKSSNLKTSQGTSYEDYKMCLSGLFRDFPHCQRFKEHCRASMHSAVLEKTNFERRTFL